MSFSNFHSFLLSPTSHFSVTCFQPISCSRPLSSCPSLVHFHARSLCFVCFLFLYSPAFSNILLHSSHNLPYSSTIIPHSPVFFHHYLTFSRVLPPLSHILPCSSTIISHSPIFSNIISCFLKFSSTL